MANDARLWFQTSVHVRSAARIHTASLARGSGATRWRRDFATVSSPSRRRATPSGLDIAWTNGLRRDGHNGADLACLRRLRALHDLRGTAGQGAHQTTRAVRQPEHRIVDAKLTGAK